MAVEILSLEAIKQRINTELGVTDWLLIDQNRIDAFADCTLDHQWIHVDQAASAKGPFGKTIAHGYLSLSLLSYFSENHMVVPQGAVIAINYGLNKVRFIAPVRVGSRIRDRIVLAAVEEKSNGRIVVTTAHTVEIQGQEKPALVAEMLTLFDLEA
jgi:acyl dehydratase